MGRVCHSPLFVSNIFSQYLIWLPGPQRLHKHKNLCCQKCIKVPPQPMSIFHYSDITALKGQLLCLSSTPYCTRYQAYWHYFHSFPAVSWPGSSRSVSSKSESLSVYDEAHQTISRNNLGYSVPGSKSSWIEVDYICKENVRFCPNYSSSKRQPAS